MDELAEPLPSERRRRKVLAEQEVTRGVQWRENPPAVACRRIYRAFLASTNRVTMVEDEVRRLVGIHGAHGLEASGIEDTLAGEFADPDAQLDCISAVGNVLGTLGDLYRGESFWSGWNEEVSTPYEFKAGFFRNTVNDIFLHHRVEWVFAGPHLVERGNQGLHADVVRPVTELLGGDPKFARVQRAYDKALLELSGGDPGDAITDANTALQEMFRVIGVDGKSASEQASRAQGKGLLLGYDLRLMEGITKISGWVNAERSQNGDAHHDGTDALKEDAWLAIHVVGALILRLSSDVTRSKPSPSESGTGVSEVLGGPGEFGLRY